MVFMGRWTITLVENEKSDIREELDAILAKSGSEAKLRHILSRIRDLDDDETHLGALRRFIYVVSALVHHLRHGDLKPQQVRNLYGLGQALLQSQEIPYGRSRLAFLYGELHLALSQVYRRDGEHWKATWEQHLSHILAREHLPGGESFYRMTAANRVLRHGDAPLAIAEYREAELLGLSGQSKEQCRIALVKALRLAGCIDEAGALLIETRQDKLFLNLSKIGLRELVWEELCLAIQRGSELDKMLTTVNPKGDHREAIYMLEAILWSLCISKRSKTDEMASVKTIGRYRDLAAHRLGFFYEICQTLENCYDTDIPLPFRLNDLGAALARTSELVTVDKELLVWAASSRWLARIKLFSLARVTLLQYEALSLRLSGGRVRDVLGCLSDMYERHWYLGRAESDGDEMERGDVLKDAV
jgi:hypothetical protein